ncbi:MAG TPA: transglutaminase family protein [Kineosporiaceae bacterium]
MSAQVPYTLIPARRLVIRHTTGYRYDRPVVASYNEARMTPLTTTTQTALDCRVDVDAMTWSTTYWDYWGTYVTAFEALGPHDELTVVSTSTVELYPADVPSADAGWDVLRRRDVADTHHEFLVQTRCTEPVEEVVTLAREAAGDRPPDQAARAVCEALRERLEYSPGSTSVHTNAVEVWQTKRGVCQDFAHLSLGALRALGIPARYVSGYLHPRPDAALGHPVEGQSHAWIEWWAGDWVSFDTTHAADVGVDHVVVARGRDYTDVTPLKGIIAGATSSELFVTVQVTRVV